MKEYIYGKNSCYEILESDKKVYEMLLLKGSKEERLKSLARDKGIKVIEMAAKQFDTKFNNARHQGVALLIDGYEYSDLNQMLHKAKQKTNPLFVMLDGLEDPHNLGSIMRTCDAIGVDGIIIPKNRSVGLNATVAKVSTGAIEHMPVAQVTNLTRTLKDLKKEGYWICGTDATNATQYDKLNYDMPLVLVVGSEGQGISRLVLKECDYIVKLPMVGHVTSLNASVATGIMLYQIYSSRNK